MEKAKEFQKIIYFSFIDYTKALDCVDHNKLWKSLKDTRPSYLPPEKSVCRSGQEQQVELEMDQQTGFKLGKKYVEAVYCHPAYLTYAQSTS